MSYRTANYNRIFRNVLHSNNTLSDDLSGDNLASIDYVNNNIESIDLTTQKNELITLQNELNNLVEKNKRIIGSIIPYFLLNPPINYLICNGQSLLTTQYQKLFNVIGYAYGGSGLYFNLPDFRSYYILGGNNNINNLAFSNLFSGNGTTGATNNYLKFGSVFPSGFPLLTKICNHTHKIFDFGHSHKGWTETQPFSSVGTEGFIKKANQDGNFNVLTQKTGITLKSTGTDINQIDPYSGLSGVNITSAFFSVNFLICYN